MTLDELDRLAAEKVMGWRRDDDEHCPSTPIYVGSNAFGLTHEKCSVEDWKPTRDIAQAWECWEKITSGGEFCCADIRKPWFEGWEVSLKKTSFKSDVPDDHKAVVLVGGGGSEMSAPETIVRACLKAKGVNL